MGHLSFGARTDQFSTLGDSFDTIFEISLSNHFVFEFMDRTKVLSPIMTDILFIPCTIMFIFIFGNIFLAIMMNSYELNVGRWKTHEFLSK